MARTATVTRTTRETRITLTLNLDGTGKTELNTGIGFFDHMLDGFARHGLFDLAVDCHGDLEVDCHHTIEDIGIALGTALREALGGKAGLVRYGSCLLPMDETLALCAVDLGGRPYFVYDARFDTPACGGMDTQMAREFFYAICFTGRMTTTNWRRCSRPLPRRWTPPPAPMHGSKGFFPQKAPCDPLHKS